MADITTLDAIDKQILTLLRSDGRSSVLDISNRVGLSPTPVARRIRRMEEAGIITSYAALIDETRLGYGVAVFVSVKLDKQVDEALVEFESAIQDFPEVVDCWLMTGNRDYMLRIATRSLGEFEQFLVGKLTRVRGVASIESSIPLRRVKAGISRAV